MGNPITVLAQHHQHSPQTAEEPTYIGRKGVYNLTIGDTLVQFTGQEKVAMAINGSIPAPTLRLRVGDTAVIYVHNRLQVETSVHWHGLLLPNEQEGVDLAIFECAVSKEPMPSL